MTDAKIDPSATGEVLEQQLEASDPDVRLMLQVKDDVEGAFEELVARYQSRLLPILGNLVGRPERAEELTQEVLLRVYRGRKGYRPRARFAVWLFTIANTVALAHIRDRARRGADDPGSGDDSGSPANSTGPAELSAAVRGAFEELGEDQKLAVLLNKFESMSYAEIAAVLGKSEAAIKPLLARSRTALRERLGPHLRADQRPA